ncbi:MAG: amidohydrolase [Oscillospiraceae bacterium]|nr:amidohydrolase [Oscillospiraceae bacterium]
MNLQIQNILAALPDGVKTVTVSVSDGIIVGIDSTPHGFIADKTINGSGRLLIPGLVNAHSHAYMTVFRNCADDLTFSDWLFGRIAPMEDQLNGEDCYWATKLACAEMLLTGTTAYYDMGMFMEEAAQACVDTGIRGVLSRGLSGAPDGVDGPNPRIDQARALYNNWKQYDNLSFLMGPHAPYSCTADYLKQAGEVAQELGIGISIHLSESESEMTSVREQYGCTPIELADRCGLLTDKTVIAHCVYATEEDIALLKARGSSVATNPISNMKLANGFAPITKMLKAGVNVALGTDGSSSNNALNMFRDLACLTLIHKANEHDPLAVTAQEAFRIATVNGARALGLDNTGEIRVGAKADLVIMDLDRPNMRPVNDPIASLCYSATGYETDTVIIGGKVLAEKGKLLNIDMDEIYAHVEKTCERIGTRK